MVPGDQTYQGTVGAWSLTGKDNVFLTLAGVVLAPWMPSSVSRGSSSDFPLGCQEGKYKEAMLSTAHKHRHTHAHTPTVLL